MKKLLVIAGACLFIAVLIAQQVVPPTTTPYVNITTGLQINGSYGTAGSALLSTGNGSNWGVVSPGTAIPGLTSDGLTPGGILVAGGGGFSGAVNVSQLNKIIKADQQAGATADAKITAACGLLPSTGGTVDARGFGSTTQSIAAQISCGSVTQPITFLFDSSTLFQAATSSQNIWKFEPRNVIKGFTFDCTNQPSYSGTIMQSDTTVPYLDSNNGENTSIEDYNVTYSCHAVTTGQAFLLQSSSAANGVEFFSGRRWRINGLANGLHFIPSSTGFINANMFSDITVSSSVNAWNFDIQGGSMEGNQCLNCSVEEITGGTYGFLIQGASGSFARNTWIGTAFDYINYMNVTAPYSVFFGNYFHLRADGSCTGNCPGAANDTGYNTFINLRFATTAPAFFWGSQGGIHYVMHSGSGVRYDTPDLSKTFQLYVNASGLYEIDGVSIGVAAEFNPGGAGTVLAGTGAGAFQGANIYNGAGVAIAIPNTATASQQLGYGPSSTTAGHLVSYADSAGRAQDSGIASTTIAPLYNASGALQASPHMVIWSGSLTAGTLTVTLTGNAIYTSSTSYACSANDNTAVAAVKVTNTSGSVFVLTGTTTDAVSGTCIGN